LGGSTNPLKQHGVDREHTSEKFTGADERKPACHSVVLS
jgi:hypothetical protein